LAKKSGSKITPMEPKIDLSWDPVDPPTDTTMRTI